MNERIIKKDNEKCIIFVCIFFFYFILGFLCNYINGFEVNAFFGTDNERAFGDFVEVFYRHYRIKVHPLLLVLWQPLFAVFKSITYDGVLAVITVHAACGAVCVCLAYCILLQFVEKKRAVLFSLIYAFSFGIIVFSASCETHIFSALMINLLVYYTYTLMTNGEKLTIIQKAILAFIGVGCFGTTITNVVMFIIAVIFLVFRKCKTRKVLNVIEVFVYFTIMVIFLLTIQTKVWKDSPVFLSSLYDAFFNKSSFEEYNFISKEISISKVCEWFREMFCYPLIASDVKIYYMENPKYNYVGFCNTSILNYILCGIYYLMFAFYGVRYFIKKKTNRLFICMLLFMLAFNYGLHFFYGYNEAFMYSPFYLCILIVLFAIFTKDVKGIPNIMTPFLLYQVINNIIIYATVAMDLRIIYKTEYAFWKLMAKLLCIVVIYAIIVAFYMYVTRKRKKTTFENKLKNIFGAYGVWMILYSFFVLIGQWR